MWLWSGLSDGVNLIRIRTNFTVWLRVLGLALLGSAAFGGFPHDPYTGGNRRLGGSLLPAPRDYTTIVLLV